MLSQAELETEGLRLTTIFGLSPTPRSHHQILVVFGSFLRVVPNLALNKAVHHGFEQSCSAMATQKLEEKIQQCDEDAESSTTGCRSPSRARISKIPHPWGRMRRTEELTVYVFWGTGPPPFLTLQSPPIPVPWQSIRASACTICDRYACRSFRAAAICGEGFAYREQNPPPQNIWGRNLKLLTDISSSPKISPPHIYDWPLLKWWNLPFQTHPFPMKLPTTSPSGFPLCPSLVRKEFRWIPAFSGNLGNILESGGNLYQEKKFGSRTVLGTCRETSSSYDVMSLREVNADGREQSRRLYTSTTEPAQQ